MPERYNDLGQAPYHNPIASTDKERSMPICLGLEGTLLNHAVSQIPRKKPSIFSWELHGHADLVLFTRISPNRSKAIQRLWAAKAPFLAVSVNSISIPGGAVKSIAQATTQGAALGNSSTIEPNVIEDHHRDWCAW